MRRTYLLGLVLSSFAIAIACSSSPSGDDGGTTDAANDTTTQKDGTSNDGNPTNDGSPSDGSPNDTGSDASDASTTLTLTIRDYLQWCSVKVNGGQPSVLDPQTFFFNPDASVALHGESASDASFYWGYWQGPGIGDGGQDLNQNVTLQMTGNVTVHACCPDNGFPLTQCTF